jgi:hypothetical protein
LYKAAVGGRLNWIGALFAIAVAGLLFFHFFAATWSNRCDPGNARYALLKSDGVVDFQPEGRLFTWVNPGPDNLWLCSNAGLSVSHIGPNIRDLYAQTREDMTRNGWAEIAPGTSADFSVFQKVKDGLKLTAVVRKEIFWVEVDLDAPGLRAGESGFG